MYVDYPCKNCVPPQRKPGCHSSCEAYLAKKKEHEENKNKKWAKQYADNITTKTICDRMDAIKKNVIRERKKR